MINLFNYDKSLLLKLIVLKLVTLLASMAVVLSAYFYFDIALPYSTIIVVFVGSAVLLMLWAVRLGTALPVTEIEIFALFISDVVVLLFLIELSGGSANPFTSSLLVPLALSAALLRKPYSLAIMVFVIAIYAVWTFGSDGGMEHMDHSGFSLHLYGMWINFLLSAIILFFFITYAMDSVRRRESQLQQAREKMLRDEQLVAVATVTASTAHALGTPLSTMSILLEEWGRDYNLDDDECKIFREQIDTCKQHLASIGKAPDIVKKKKNESADVKTLYKLLKDHFQLLRPVSSLIFNFNPSLDRCKIIQGPGLLLAIANLVDNALQAKSSVTSVAFERIGKALAIVITDNGEGLSAELRESLGKTFITTKNEGWGLGVYLSHSTIEQSGGKITMVDGPSGGTITTVEMPLC